MIQSYKDLVVWQQSVQLTIDVYEITKRFPKNELYGLTSQLRRGAVSIASNIAEGRNRGSKEEFVQFLRIAYSSGAEVETQIEISKRLGYIDIQTSVRVFDSLSGIMKMLNVMIRKLTATP